MSFHGNDQFKNPVIEMPDLEKYISACESEELLEDVCHDIISCDTFKISTVRLLREGEVSNDRLNVILSKLIDVIIRKHRKNVLLLICLLFDYVEIDSNVIKKLCRAGVDNFVSLEISPHIPDKSSNYLNRFFFDAYYREKVNPILFGSSLSSPSFCEFCTKYEKERTFQIIKSWADGTHGNFRGVTVVDTVDCVIQLVNGTGADDDVREIKALFKRWRDKGELDALSQEGMGSDVCRIIGW